MLNASIYAIAGGFEHLFNQLVKAKGKAQFVVDGVSIDEERECVHVKIYESTALYLYAYISPKEIKVYDNWRYAGDDLLFEVGLPVMITETLLPLVVETIYAVAYRERQSRFIEA